mmetsp:Transcript_57915/g.163508  ORF Transcript_57915/g.163508 Transcript_57915/m.163508 type:complete len:270 (+) Transcript_57915:471-1280(+)
MGSMSPGVPDDVEVVGSVADALVDSAMVLSWPACRGAKAIAMATSAGRCCARRCKTSTSECCGSAAKAEMIASINCPTAGSTLLASTPSSTCCKLPCSLLKPDSSCALFSRSASAGGAWRPLASLPGPLRTPGPAGASAGTWPTAGLEALAASCGQPGDAGAAPAPDLGVCLLDLAAEVGLPAPGALGAVAGCHCGDWPCASQLKPAVGGTPSADEVSSVSLRRLLRRFSDLSRRCAVPSLLTSGGGTDCPLGSSRFSSSWSCARTFAA